MSTLVTMSSTVGDLTSGQTYRVRTKNAELLVAQSKATVVNKKGANSGIAADKEGKRGA